MVWAYEGLMRVRGYEVWECGGMKLSGYAGYQGMMIKICKHEIKIRQKYNKNKIKMKIKCKTNCRSKCK